MCNPLRIATVTAALALALVPAAAGAATFTNGGTININDEANATPYPSSIAVSGVTGSITDLNVRLHSLTHPRPFEVGVVLVGPGGQALLLMDGVTSGVTAQPASNVTVTVDDEAAAAFPPSSALASTSYRPASYVADDFFPAPGPQFAYGNPGPAGGGTQTLSSIYDGTSPNGTWNLYVRDFVTVNSGQIAAGWSLEFPDAAATTPTPPGSAPIPAPKKCKKGRKLKKGKCVKKRKRKKP